MCCSIHMIMQVNLLSVANVVAVVVVVVDFNSTYLPEKNQQKMK